MDDPSVHSALSALASDSDSGSDADSDSVCRCLLHCADDHVFVWGDNDSSVTAVNMGGSVEDGSTNAARVQKFQLTDTPVFDVSRLTSSARRARFLCAWGRRGVACIELPKRTGKAGRFCGGSSSATVRSFSIAERFFLCQSRVEVQQVEFHPGAPFDAHIVVLSSDNYLRIYDLDEDRMTPEQSISLNASVPRRQPASFFADSAITVKGSLGETAVSFSFAPPTDDAADATTGGDALWPMFVLHGNGSVFCLTTGLGAHRRRVGPDGGGRMSGPLAMLPQRDDDYGGDASCALLCLHPLISSPPILVIATNGGVIYHCVVLNRSGNDDTKAEEEDDNRSQFSEWSNFNETDLALYVYESVELDLTFGGSGNVSKDKPFDYPILLEADPTSPARYFCSHKAGVHAVGLPMVAKLADIAGQPDHDTTLATLDQQDSSVVEHLICTQLSGSSRPSPILGVTVHYPPTQLICLLSNYRVQTVSLAAPYFSTPSPITYTDQSPLKKSGDQQHQQQDREPFDARIKRMLVKSTTHPLMRAAGSSKADMEKEEMLELLARSTQILRDEYLSRLEAVRAEIERRVLKLRAQKESQRSSLAAVAAEKSALRDKAADLSERYEDLRDSGAALTARLELVLQRLQSAVPIESDAELRMQRQLQDVQRRMKELRAAMERISAKEKYQMRQIKDEVASPKKWRDSKGSPYTNGGVGFGDMGENQLASVREVLETDGKEIARLVKTLNAAKRDIAA